MENQKCDVQSQQTKSKLAQIFEDPFNTVCYECGRKTRQWVQMQLAIYLCFKCCDLYKEASKLIVIKCITTDLFSSQQLKYLQNGGNRKFKQFLSNYDMQELVYHQRLKTKAVAYYRILLKEQVNGRVLPMAPDVEVGKQQFKEEKEMGDMSAGQMLYEIKNKAVNVGENTLNMGGQALMAVQHKFSSGQLAEDAKILANEIGNKAKGLWNAITNNFESSQEAEPKK